MLGNPGFRRDIGKGPIPIIAVECVRQRLVPFGDTVGAQLARQTYRILVYLPFHVVGDKQIKQPVIVVIRPRGRYRPHLLAFVHSAAHAGLVSEVGKSPISVVVKKLIAGDAGKINIRPAVVIVVADGNAHAVAGASQARFVGHVSKRQIMVVAIQAVLVLRTVLFKRWNRGAVDHVDVQVAVAIIVQQRNPSDHGLRLVLIRGRRAVGNKTNSRALGNLFKANGAGRGRGG